MTRGGYFSLTFPLRRVFCYAGGSLDVVKFSNHDSVMVGS